MSHIKESEMKRTYSVRRTSKVALLLIISLVVGAQPAYPVFADDLPTLLGEGLPYYIPGDTCGGNAGANTGAVTADGHTLPAATGGTGFEEAISTQGQVPIGGGYVTFADNVRNASTAPIAADPENRSLQDLYRQYYITMRWRYVKWNWNGGGVSPGPEGVDFYSKAPRVLVTNKRTGKSIISVILEAGPAPWTGVDDHPNNTPKQGWTNPQDGTPATYKGRVSGFPPRAIADLGATQVVNSTGGDELIYQWAPDQNALPGPVGGTTPGSGATNLPAGECANGAAGNVNTEGYSFPVADQKKHSYGTLPCNKTSCHHDGTAAFDLMYGPEGNMDGKAVYAITNGTIENVHVYGGVTGCYSIQFKSDMTNGQGNYFYWYGHLQNPKVAAGQKVAAGEQIAEVGRNSLGSDCRGGRDHLHIDRGCIEGGVPQTGGSKRCRDPEFVRLMDSIWNQLSTKEIST
jgi:murein DD-endopeptidase MepM/ murein hydrolase activator NlpD